MKDPFANLTPGQLYSRSDIMEIIKQKGLTPHNPAAFTYNRWNKGMQEPQPFFEYVRRNQYKYLGVVDYEGDVFNDQRGGVERQIALWDGSGGYTFLDPMINNFNEWKASDFEGIAFITEGSNLRLKMSGEEMLYAIRSEAEKKKFDSGFDNDYKIISSTSKFGEQLLGKKVDDTFDFGQSSVEIIAIS